MADEIRRFLNEYSASLDAETRRKGYEIADSGDQAKIAEFNTMIGLFKKETSDLKESQVKRMKAMVPKIVDAGKAEKEAAMRKKMEDAMKEHEDAEKKKQADDARKLLSALSALHGSVEQKEGQPGST